MKLLLSNKQKEYILSPFKSNVLEVNEGTPRSGKSVSICLRYYLYLNQTEDVNHAVFSYNIANANRIYLEGSGFGLQHLFKGSKYHRDKYGDYLSIDTLKGEKKIYIFPAGKSGDEKRFTGISLGSFILGEVNLLNQEVVNEAFRRTFAAKHRLAICDMNPPNPHNWVITDLMKSQPIIYRKWTLNDNPALSSERIEELKNILIKTPLLYKRDFLGERVLPTGLVYSIFDKDKNTISEQEFNNRLKSEYVYDVFFAVDVGSSNPTAVFAWIITKENDFIITSKSKGPTYHIYAVDLLYLDDHQPFSQQAIKLKEFVDKICNTYRVDHRYSSIIYDSAAPAFALECERVGLLMTPSIKRNVKNEVEYVQSQLAERKFLILDMPNMGPFYKELSLYSYDDKGEIIKDNDHTMDALRYGINKLRSDGFLN